MTRVPLGELPEFVRNVRATLKLMPRKNSATLVFLQGNLGAGKTTFMQALGKELGIPDLLQSPTYVLMKKYDVPGDRLINGAPRRFKKLVHIDAYRLNAPGELSALRPQDFLLDPDALVMIEWPERVAEALPQPDMILTFNANDAAPHERHIHMEGAEANRSLQ